MSGDLEFLEDLSSAEVEALRAEVERELEHRRLTGSLAEFVRGAWHILEPGRELVWNWHLETVCAYLEAVHRRRIRRLIVNIPPGSMKSLMVSVFYPAWVWIDEPSHRFLCGSNEGTLATRDGLRMRTLVESDWYQERWGDLVQISVDQREKTLFSNRNRGHRESQGILAKITGKRGDTLIWDDPHDTKQSESDVQRKAVLDAWDFAWSSRMNDPDTSAAILIMQRVHHQDITGHLMAKDGQNWVLLAVPMRYDPELSYNSDRDIGRLEIRDPRREEAELMFPARYSEETVRNLEIDLGAYGAAGQLQQRPSPKGGGELRREWLCRWRTQPRRGNYAVLVDPAGERKPGAGKRDNTAMGLILIGEDENYYLIDGYRDRLNMSERADILFRWHRQYKPLAVGYERYGMQSDIPYLQDRMEREDYRFHVTELGGSLAKEDRIRRLIPLLEARRLWLPETLHRTGQDGKTVDIVDRFIEEEFLPFPVGARDDFLDMLSRISDPAMKSVLVAPLQEPDFLDFDPPFEPCDPAMGM